MQRHYKGPPLPMWLFSFTLIFCPSRGRGLVLSCLSPRQFYLSITKPSTVWQRPQHCINPLSASQPSITLLSITSDPSSAHLSHTAHARSKSQRAEGTVGQKEIRGKCKKRVKIINCCSFSLPPSAHILLKAFTTCLLDVVFSSF